ncbi:MAG: DUF3291 domain-containing protein, partial [Steroidobacteraceae bacterium]
AERSPGFVWRLQSEAGNATDIQSTSDPLFLVNMSLWSDAEALVSGGRKLHSFGGPKLHTR